MKRRSSVSRRVLALLVVLGVALTIAPQPLYAADTSQSTAPPAPLAASIAHAARTVALDTSAPTKAAAKDEQPGTEDLRGSSAFFKQPLGIAVLGVLAAGVSYAIYSTSHDRIHSEVRQGQ